MQVTFLTRKSALIYRRGLRQRVASLTLDCNGVFAINLLVNLNQSCIEVPSSCVTAACFIILVIMIMPVLHYINMFSAEYL